MARKESENLLFVVEYFDPQPQTKKKYLLRYFVDSHAVEMIDFQKKKLFLKKSPCPPEITISDFVLGSKIFIYARELLIIDYGDGTTRKLLHKQTQKCVAMISSDVYQDWGMIISVLEKEMTLAKLRSVLISEVDAEIMMAMLQIDAKYKASLTRGVNLLVVFHAENGFQLMRDIIVREGLSQGVFIASNEDQTIELSQKYLSLKTTATYDSCTCCVIRPHAVKDKNAGNIIDKIIKQGYEVSAIDSFQFDKLSSEEFLEVYKGVIPEYSEHVVQLCSGLSVCMELRAEDAVEVFRQTAGPWDVDMARELRPESIRAKYGSDIIKNAVHCTDLAQDGQAECEYCFDIMQMDNPQYVK